jgi:hypothetical protein
MISTTLDRKYDIKKRGSSFQAWRTFSWDASLVYVVSSHVSSVSIKRQLSFMGPSFSFHPFHLLCFIIYTMRYKTKSHDMGFSQLSNLGIRRSLFTYAPLSYHQYVSILHSSEQVVVALPAQLPQMYTTLMNAFSAVPNAHE